MQSEQRSHAEPILVTANEGTTIEVGPAGDGGVHVAMSADHATLTPRTADDLVHAVLEAMALERA
jgi:hypothetical protein